MRKGLANFVSRELHQFVEQSTDMFVVVVNKTAHCLAPKLCHDPYEIVRILGILLLHLLGQCHQLEHVLSQEVEEGAVFLRTLKTTEDRPEAVVCFGGAAGVSEEGEYLVHDEVPG